MKLIKFEKKQDGEYEKKLNKRKVIISIIILIIIIILVILAALYVTNTDTRNYIDTNIFRKNITEDNTTFIEIKSENNPHVYAYDKYVVLLEKNTLTRYSASGKEEKVKVEISNPIFASSEKSLIIAEKDKTKIYSILDGNILWQKDLEGNITRISVNKNGYVSVILSGTTYKSVIVIFDKDGKELFRTYLSNTIAVDCSISNDNQYMSFAEINTSGTLIQSTIKVVSIEKAKQKPDEAIIYTHEGNENSIIVNIKYQERNTIIALYNDRIESIKNDKVNVITRLDEKDKNITFGDIELNNCVYRVIEKSTGFFNSESTVEIINSTNNKENVYLVNGVAKNVFSNEGVIAINMGTEIHFIGINGWLIKKYSSKQEFKDIVITNNIVGIVYRDRIELISL